MSDIVHTSTKLVIRPLISIDEVVFARSAISEKSGKATVGSYPTRLQVMSYLGQMCEVPSATARSAVQHKQVLMHRTIQLFQAHLCILVCDLDTRAIVGIAVSL
jgi:hypothetical protein